MTLVCNPVLETANIKYTVQPGCGFLDEGYYRATYNAKTKRGQVHSGIDLNATTGHDTDYGNRVRAIADGVVVAAGDYNGWGGIVLIWHPELKVWSQSAHLIGIQVAAGQKVLMGDVIGGIGKGEHGRFWAHLHFEIRVSDLPADFWASTRFPSKAGAEAYIKEHYRDPEEFLRQHNALRTYDEVMTAIAARPNPAIVSKRPPAATATKTGTIWAQVQDVDGKPRAGEVVSIAVDGEGRILADKKTGRPKVIRVPASRLHERKY